MEGFVKPNQVSFEGNVAENWKRFKQKFEIFVIASGYENKSNKEKCCMLLNLELETLREGRYLLCPGSYSYVTAYLIWGKSSPC